MRCDPHATHAAWHCASRCMCHIGCVASCTHASRQWGRCSGKIIALEILAPWKNKHPRKCNLFWARKVLEIFKYSDHFSGTEYARNSLNIPGIFPQYSAFEYFLLFTM